MTRSGRRGIRGENRYLAPVTLLVVLVGLGPANYCGHDSLPLSVDDTGMLL